ncbi:hypothetical protein MRX96_040221 [Rhipicephalus microplus]
MHVLKLYLIMTPCIFLVFEATTLFASLFQQIGIVFVTLVLGWWLSLAINRLCCSKGKPPPPRRLAVVVASTTNYKFADYRFSAFSGHPFGTYVRGESSVYCLHYLSNRRGSEGKKHCYNYLFITYSFAYEQTGSTRR